MATGMFSGGAAFGVFPQMQPRRRFQDPVGAANVPLDVTRGRFAGLAGLLPDALNFMGRSPMPTEMFGDTQYEPTQQLPYGSEYYLQNLPLKPTSRIGEVAGQAGAFVPLNPMPAVRAVAAGARALGPTAVRMGEGYLQSKGLMPNVVPEGGAIPGSYDGSSVLMNPKNLTPLNKIEDANKYKSILNSMQEFGYQGRPILAYMDNGQAKALTGSHRLYAARNAGIDVPVVFVKPSVMKWEDNEGLFGTFKESINDQRVYEHLKAAGDDIAASLAKLEDQIYQPAGMLGGPIKPQAPVSELGFYSATEQAALNLPRKSGTGESFLNDLMKGQDVKKDELSWMGLDDYLKGKPNVTRQEVQDFIANNRVDVREVRLGDKEVKLPSTIGLLKREEILNKYQPKLDALYAEDANYANLTPQRYEELGQEIRALERQRDVEADAAYVIPPLPQLTPTKFQQYQLPGGENYREILLTLPFKEPPMPRGYGVSSVQYEDGTRKYFAETPTSRSQGFKTQEEAQSELAKTAANLKGFRQNLEAYKSSHFNEPNILAHMRVNDRVDADGKKMLLIEEIQSDWHQAGREKGYAGNYAKGDVKPYTPERAKAEFGLPNNDLFWYFEVPGNTLQIPKSRFGTQDEAMNYVLTEKKVNPEGVPDAPFKDTWHQLALKRALKYAADNGYDRVGLTTGRQQAERYNLAKQVDYIDYVREGPDKYRMAVVGKDGQGVNLPKDIFSEVELKSYLGNDVAKRIVNGEGSSGGGRMTLRGPDLQVGGEGMKKYYDEIYPAFLAKQGKKYNAKTGEIKIKTGNAYAQTKGIPAEQSIRYIDISPEMRGGVKKGQPLFTAAPIGGIGLGAGTQDNEMPDAVRQYMADPRYSDPFADTTR